MTFVQVCNAITAVCLILNLVCLGFSIHYLNKTKRSLNEIESNNAKARQAMEEIWKKSL